MLAPTPMLRPSPLDIGGLFAGAFEALKRKLGLFLLLALLPAIVTVLLVGLGIVVLVGIVAQFTVSGSASDLGAGILAGIGLIFIGVVVVLLVHLKAIGMMSAAAYEVAQGGSPTFSGMFSVTRGFLPRMLAVIAIVVVGSGLVYAALIGVLVAVAGGLAADGSRAGASGAVAAVSMIVLLLLAAVPVAWFLIVKLLYTVPAIVVEQLGGIQGMKRSWRLTKGAFWRTFGYYLLASVAAGAVSYVVSLVGQLVPLSLLSTLDSRDWNEPATVLATLGPALIVWAILQICIQALAEPFLQIYVTYMYIDQVRRSELPPAPYGGQPVPYPGAPTGTPGYGTPPAQPYGTPPAQPYGPPAQPYGPPSQPYSPPQQAGSNQPMGPPPPAWPGQGGPAPQPPGYQPPPGYPPNQGGSGPQHP